MTPAATRIAPNFRIDKLFAPESSRGRLGLVEMRAFEMPPHARMSLAQHLLLRGLVAKFWKEPYKNDLVRWGTDIHDRWMLPHFCETDFKDVISDLREAGYPFEFDWFAPHFEFRFPRIGDLEQRDIQIELRTALEPWHVLGEEPGGGGTVRYVDSSLERLQVKARGLVGDRFAITVQRPSRAAASDRHQRRRRGGRALSRVAAAGMFAADHRRRMRRCGSILMTPGTSVQLGGCTYHVAHPGGRSYDTFPVNSYEAESAPAGAIFPPRPHAGQVVTPPPKTRIRDFPFTLDLRNV